MLTICINQNVPEMLGKHIAADKSYHLQQAFFKALDLKLPYPFATFNGLKTTNTNSLILLTPLSLMAGHNSVELLAGGEQLLLTQQEMQQVADTIMPILSPYGLKLVDITTEHLLLESKLTFDYEPWFKLFNSEITTHLDIPENKKEGQRLFTECQMAISNCQLNIARQQQGYLPINGVWLWGMGNILASKKEIKIFTDSEKVRLLLRDIECFKIFDLTELSSLSRKDYISDLLIYIEQQDFNIDRLIKLAKRNTAVQVNWSNAAINYKQNKWWLF